MDETHTEKYSSTVPRSAAGYGAETRLYDHSIVRLSKFIVKVA